MLALIALILFGIAVITVATVVLLRPARATVPRESRYPDPERAETEREVYEKLYGKRSATVSAPLPVEPPPKTDADSPRTHKPSSDARPRTPRRSRAQDSHR
jgi:hypothetical protein